MFEFCKTESSLNLPALHPPITLSALTRADPVTVWYMDFQIMKNAWAIYTVGKCAYNIYIVHIDISFHKCDPIIYSPQLAFFSLNIF